MKIHRHYGRHIEELCRRYDRALDAAGLDAVLIGAGLAPPVFRDDQHYPYRPEPLFLQWASLEAHPGSFLYYQPGKTPRLVVFSEEDYWHQPAPIPKGPWQRHLNVSTIADRRQVTKLVAGTRRRQQLALLGDPGQWAGLALEGQRNPRGLLQQLDYDRATKTAWEVDCIRGATHRALAGHAAVRQGFESGLSEFELGLMFLAASGQSDHELAYPAIIARNANAATLHYQHRLRERLSKRERLSLLIDAGCTFGGYASDITRTYAGRKGEFATILADADRMQQQLCAAVRPGVAFPELHLAAHRAIGECLQRWDVVRMDADAMVDAKVTDHFFPHGLGHFLGLQVHDVGGGMAGPLGGELPRPKRFPRLRLTRTLEPGHVVTIEPGIYFIDSLLDRLRRGPHRRRVNWKLIGALKPYGGIRIEDDVLVTSTGFENLTRHLSGGR